MKKGIPILLEVNLEFGDLKVCTDVLTKVKELQRKYNYTPTLVDGIHKINKEQHADITPMPPRRLVKESS